MKYIKNKSERINKWLRKQQNQTSKAQSRQNIASRMSDAEIHKFLDDFLKEIIETTQPISENSAFVVNRRIRFRTS